MGRLSRWAMALGVLWVVVGIGSRVPVAAHPGHGHAKLLGTVETVSAKALTIRDRAGKVLDVALTPTTVFRRGDTLVKASDVKRGDRVAIDTAAAQPPYSASEVRLSAAPATTAQPHHQQR